MSDYGFVHPPPPPPPPPSSSTPSAPLDAEVVRPRRHLRAAAGAAVAVVVAVAAAGGILAFRAMHGSADSLVSMVPSDTAVYVNVNFDPPGGQKLAVSGLLNKFPGLSDQSRAATVNGWLDAAFAGSGLNHADISGWLGSELSVAMPASALSSLTPSITSKASSPPSAAILIASKDNGKAQAALDKFRRGPVGSANKWTTSVYGGVTVTAGTTASTGGAYAITNNTLIVGSDAAAVDAVIDTAQGKRANLQSSGGYKQVEGQLPADRLALGYVDIAAVVKQIGSSITSFPGGPAQLNAGAYGGLGVALVASSDGIALTGTENYDASKLTPDQRSLVATAPHANGSIDFVPKTAYGLVAYSGLQQALRSILKTVAPPGSAMDRTLQQFGVTGAGGIIGHLSGDGGIEVDKVPGQTVPGGAFLFDTDSTTAAQHFLDHLVSSLCRQSGVCDLPQLTTQVDQGVTISSVPLSGGADVGVEPSWAVSNGWAIVGSSPAEVRAALDSKASGSGIDKSSAFQTVTSHVSATNNELFYMDVPAVVSAIRNVLPPAAQASFDHTMAPYLSPIGAVALSGASASGHLTFTFFVQIR
jgi:hypothetical protein